MDIEGGGPVDSIDLHRGRLRINIVYEKYINDYDELIQIEKS